MQSRFIRFRCPVCEHKVRIHGAGAGGQCKCRCGSVIAVPGSRPVMKRESNWLEASRFVPARAVRLSRACSPSQSSAPSTCGKNDGFRQGVLVGSSAVLAVSLIVASFLLGLNLARSSGSPVPVAKAADDQPAAREQPAEPKAPVAVVAVKPTAGKPAELNAPVIKVVDIKATVNPPKVKVPARVADKIEILAWYTASKFIVVGDAGEKEVLFLNEADLKAGSIFVAIKVRLPARLLAGSVLNLPDADVQLRTPGKESLAAIGCGTQEGQWYAPDQGKYAYQTQGDEAVQTWLFEANLSDLESGRTLFHFRAQPAESLTTKLRVKAP